MADQYALEEIEAAWRKGSKNWAAFREDLEAPKHQFREGEVVVVPIEPAGEYVVFQGHPFDYRDCRPLRLSEMPKQIEDKLKAADDLRAAMAEIYKAADGILDAHQWYKDKSRSALAAFDEVV